MDSLNNGNSTPSALPDELVQAMASAGAAIGSYLGLKGQWGLDFVLQPAGAEAEPPGCGACAGAGALVPVIVDLNMGRPNGSLAYYLWRSVQQPPAALALLHEQQRRELAPPPAPLALAQVACYRRPHPHETPAEFVQLLKEHGLLFLPSSSRGRAEAERAGLAGCVEGVVLAQHIPGEWSTILCVSWRGLGAARALYGRLSEADRGSGCQYGNK